MYTVKGDGYYHQAMHVLFSRIFGLSRVERPSQGHQPRKPVFMLFINASHIFVAMDHFKSLTFHKFRCGAHFPRFHFHGSIAFLDFYGCTNTNQNGKR